MKFYRDDKDISFEAPHSGDAGWDLRTPKEFVLHPKEAKLIPLGLYLEIPMGFVGIIKDRSSMAKLKIFTAGGVIDRSYRGEIIVCLRNDSEELVKFERGQKIAQIVILRCYQDDAFEVEFLSDLAKSERATGGFGSTGKF